MCDGATPDLVAAIRADRLVGTGTCTSIDECWEDSELREALSRDGVTTATGAVEWARKAEGLWLEQACNARWGEDDDPQLAGLYAFREAQDAEY
jgi:hypothetical protein